MGRAVKAIIAVIAAALALTGCAGQSPANAATVNQVAITETQVDEVAQALANIFESPDSPGAQRRLAANILIGNELGRAIGAATGTSIPAEQRAEMIAQYQDLSALNEQPGMAQIVDDYVAAALIRAELGEEQFASAAAAVPVDVNPRYGDWDPSVAQLTTSSGSLSVPAADAATNS